MINKNNLININKIYKKSKIIKKYNNKSNKKHNKF